MVFSEVDQRSNLESCVNNQSSLVPVRVLVMPRRSGGCMYKSFNVLLLEAYNVNVLSVAIFALVFTSRVTFVFADGSCSIDECSHGGWQW